MLLSRRHFLISSLALGACGFTPVYGPGGSASGLRGNISVADPDDRFAYELVKQLDNQLDPAPGARFQLSYDITVQEEGVGVTPEQVIRRIQLRGAVIFAVTDTVSGQVVDKGSVSSFTAYSTEGSTIASSSAKRDAERRLMTTLGNLIATRLIATASDWMA